MSGTNGGLDPSIPLQAGRGVQQPNALQQLGQFANTQNALNQAKLFPLIQQQQQLATKQRALEYATAGYQGIQARAAAHYLDPGDINPKHVMTDVMEWATNQNAAFPDQPPISMSQVVGILKGLPMPDGNGPDAWRDPAYQQKLRAAIKLQYVNTLGPLEALKQATGTSATMSNGLTVQPGMVGGPLSSTPFAFTPAGSSTDQYPSRSEQAHLVDVPGAAGGTEKRPLGTVVQETRPDLVGPPGRQIQVPGLPPSLRNPANQPQSQPSPQGAAPAAPPPPAAGAPPIAPPVPPAPTAPAPADIPPVEPPRSVVPPASPGSVPGTLPASTQAAIASSGALYAGLRNNAAQFQSRLFPLTQALDILQSPKGADVGAGSETVQNLKKILYDQAPDSMKATLGKLGISAEKLSNFDQLAKYLTQYSANLPGAGATDLRMMTATMSQPNTHVTKDALVQLIKKTIGVERMQQAAMLAFDKSPNGGMANATGFADYMDKFMTKADPVGFEYDLMSPAERGKYQQTLNPGWKTGDPLNARQKNFLASVRVANELGVLTHGAAGQ